MSDSDWRARWAAERQYAAEAATQWATALVAAGTPPVLVLEALAAAGEAVKAGIAAAAADILKTLQADAPAD
ncbi:MAG TPA: hypothetical protein VF601_06570 [Beijerinckiaceae bacterium]|jgi:hypothetical protein